MEGKHSVYSFGKKKTAVAVARVFPGTGIIRVGGKPISICNQTVLRSKMLDPLRVIGKEYYNTVDVKVTARGGGQVSQIYAIRQAIARGVVAYYQKFVDEVNKTAIKESLLHYDRSLLISDPRRCEAKKFGGRGARARKQKSYR